MEKIVQTSLRSQFSAALQMLENALKACPPDLWKGRLWQERELRPEFVEYWYIASHALFWTDYYLSGGVKDFSPPTPFTLVELDPAGVLPDRVYTRDELLKYLAHCRKKARVSIETLTEETASRVCRMGWGSVTYLELLLDTMRHIQEHAAQLNLYLGQVSRNPARWVSLDQ